MIAKANTSGPRAHSSAQTDRDGKDPFGIEILLLSSQRSRAILSLAAHLSAFASVMIACAYTCKAMVSLPYVLGAVVGAVFYIVLVIIVWE